MPLHTTRITVTCTACGRTIPPGELFDAPARWTPGWLDQAKHPGGLCRPQGQGKLDLEREDAP